MSMFNRSIWEYAGDSCGREISTSLPGKRRAWFAQGPAREIYENSLKLQVESVLKLVSADCADVTVCLYMIGKSEAASRPAIMVCCSRSELGKRAKIALRKSQIVAEYPAAGFIFERIRHPLESPRAHQALAANSTCSCVYNQSSGTGVVNKTVFSTSTSPDIGRSLYRCRSDTRLVLWSTAGVLLQLDKQILQLTVEHTWVDGSENSDLAVSSHDEDEDWSIDGFDDDDEIDNTETDHDVLSHGSATPERITLSSSMLSMARQLSQNKTGWNQSSDEEMENEQTDDVLSSRSLRRAYNISNTSLGARSHSLSSRQSPFSKIGVVSIQASEGARPGLDYALVSIPTPVFPELVNELIIPNASDTEFRYLQVRKLASAFYTERHVILTGQDGRPRTGTIFPGSVLFKRADLDTFENLQFVQINSALSKGDCGASVLDAETGAFYGHLIRGCPGTGAAYVVPAAGILQDLFQRGFKAQFASARDSDPDPIQTNTGTESSHSAFESRIESGGMFSWNGSTTNEDHRYTPAYDKTSRYIEPGDVDSGLSTLHPRELILSLWKLPSPESCIPRGIFPPSLDEVCMAFEDYYYRRWYLTAGRDDRMHVSLKTSKELNDYVLQISAAEFLSRDKLLLMLSTNGRAPSTEEAATNTLNLALSLLLMVKFGPNVGETQACRYLHWTDGCLKDCLLSHFSKNFELDFLGLRLPVSFNARSLKTIGGISIRFTDNLDDHLLFVEEEMFVYIFHHVSFLEYSHSSIFPDGLLEETLKTLLLVFPEREFGHVGSFEAPSRPWLQRLVKSDPLGVIDPRIGACGNLEAEDRRIERFEYWRDRLVVLKQAYDEATPKTVGQWWNDRRNRVVWWTFWIAVSVLGLSIIVGIVQCVVAGVQLSKS